MSGPDDASPTIPPNESGPTLPPGQSGPTLPPHAAAPRRDYGEHSGDQIGPYRLLKVLGEGGFGVVWLAERREPMVQRVALKIIKPGMDSRMVVARFEQERQALAMMDHANVAKVFDGGVTDAGRPYFVMEYVAGESITAYADRERLGIRARLDLFIQACEAVQHAHTKGIIHRDIKPSNILISVSEGPPTVKVIDFGVAKAISHTLTDKTIFTETGQMIGTPEYMSPEQAEMGVLAIDTRTDVYSLGVVLYEMLVGAVPFESRTLRSKGYAEIQRIIRNTEPPKPSTRLTNLGGKSAAIALNRQVRIESLLRQLRHELEWIPLRALRKDRTQRYQSPHEMADDVRRYLRGEALVAGPESTWYRLRKFIRRNKGAVSAVSAVVLALAIGLGLALWQATRAAHQASLAREAERHAAHERDAAKAALRRAQTVSAFVQSTLTTSDPTAGGDQSFTVLDAMDAAIRELTAGAYHTEPDLESAIQDTIAQVLIGNGAATKAEPLATAALNTRRTLATGDSEEVASSLNNVAAAREALGRLREAEPLYREALEMRQRLANADTGGDRADVAQSLSNLGYALQKMKRFDDADALYQQALAMRRRLFTGDHAELAMTLANLGSLRLAQGRAADAEPLLQQALDMRLRLAGGRDDPVVAKSQSSLGTLRMALGRADEALPLLQQSLAMNERLFMGDHPLIAANLDSLSFVLQYLDRTSEAEPLCRRALEIRQRLSTGDSQELATNLFNLARILQDLHQPGRAMPLYEQALAMRRRLFDEADPDVAISMAGLAGATLDMGRAADARPLAESAVNSLKAKYPEGHPRCALAMSTLALVLHAQGHRDEARALIVEAAAMVLRTQPATGAYARRVLDAQRIIDGH